jgi:hypothetical protein
MPCLVHNSLAFVQHHNLFVFAGVNTSSRETNQQEMY